MCSIRANIIKVLECPVGSSLLLDDDSYMGKKMFEQFISNYSARMVAVDLKNGKIEDVEKSLYSSVEEMRKVELDYFVLFLESGCALVYSLSKKKFKLCEQKV